MTISGVILAGGESTRMGQPKEGVRLPGGRTMIEHVANALRPLVGTLIVAGVSSGFNPTAIGAERVDDRRAQHGPLAGIEAALVSTTASHLIIVTCDQPLLTSELLRTLLPVSANPVALRTDRDEELLPFPCLLPATLADSVRTALDAGERSPSRWLRSLTIEWRTIDHQLASLVQSINTPEQLAALRTAPARKP